MLSNKCPEVSIITPAYNSGRYISDAIESVRCQLFQDWEMIIVDDASTDDTENIARSLADQDQRVRYYRLDYNSGSPVFPRNYAVSRSCGRYLAFLDSDDYWYPGKLITQLKLIKMTNTTISYHDIHVYRNHNLISDWSRMSACFKGMVFRQLLRKNFIPTSSVLMIKELYEVFGNMNPCYTIAHDWDLWLKIARNNAVSFCEEKLGVLNLHDESVSTKLHIRRKESREIIRTWRGKCPATHYYPILMCYYLVELIDKTPNYVRRCFRIFTR